MREERAVLEELGTVIVGAVEVLAIVLDKMKSVTRISK